MDINTKLHSMLNMRPLANVPLGTNFELEDYWEDRAVLGGQDIWPVSVTLNPLVASLLSFSLITPEGSLADAIALDISHRADWADGLNMLWQDGRHVTSKEVVDFIQALMEIGLKIKLLGASPPPPSLGLFLVALSPTASPNKREPETDVLKTADCTIRPEAEPTLPPRCHPRRHH
jgi:hypothetical protein